jgi:hypothetical protein
MPAKSHLPGHVVRFYGTVDFALDAIAHRQVTFVHASKLNDPFDPYFFFETDFDENYETLLRYVQKKRPDDERWFTHHVPRHSWDQTIVDLIDHLQKAKRKDVRSFDERPAGRRASQRQSLHVGPLRKRPPRRGDRIRSA